MFVTKYTPTDYWLSNKGEAYQGGIQSKKVNKLTEFIDVEAPFDDDLLDGNNDYDVGAGPGGSAGTYSADYPTDCFGTVIISMEMITHLCQCVTPGHLPGGCNDCSNPGYYEYVPRYSCIDDGNYNPDVPDDSGGSIGGVSPPDPIDDISIAVTILPINCTAIQTTDPNADCYISPYEYCKLSYSVEVCDCEAAGGILEDCILEQFYNHMDRECQGTIIAQCLNIDSNITNKVTNVFFGNDDYNLQFLDVDLPSQLNSLASTELPSGMSFSEDTVVNIRFDNTYLDNATDLSMVLTTAHEFIHVNFFYLYIEGILLSTYPDYTAINNAFENNLGQLNFEILQDAMHNVYDDFIEDMIASVYIYANENNITGATEEYCRKLVIGHHQNTDAFQNLSEEDQSEYSAVAENEQNGQTDAKGSKCDD